MRNAEHVTDPCKKRCSESIDTSQNFKKNRIQFVKKLDLLNLVETHPTNRACAAAAFEFEFSSCQVSLHG